MVTIIANRDNARTGCTRPPGVLERPSKKDKIHH
jgi:hypothetical protein